MTPHPLPRVCIIGAGSSGIAAAQVLDARGIDFDCFEMGSEIGGNWRYGNDNGVSSAYRSLHINTSRTAMEYAAYPMPDRCRTTRATGRSRSTSTTSSTTSGCATRSPSAPRSSRSSPLAESGGGYDVTAPPLDDARAPRRATTTTCWSPTATTGTRAGRSRLPRQRDLPRGADARALLPDARRPRRQARGGPRDRQLRHRHRRGVLAGRRRDLPGDAARGPHPAEVPVRRPDRPPHRLAAGARSAALQKLGHAGDAAARGRQDDRLRPARARPRRARGAPDRQRRPAHPARATATSR